MVGIFLLFGLIANSASAELGEPSAVIDMRPGFAMGAKAGFLSALAYEFQWRPVMSWQFSGYMGGLPFPIESQREVRNNIRSVAGANLDTNLGLGTYGVEAKFFPFDVAGFFAMAGWSHWHLSLQVEKMMTAHFYANFIPFGVGYQFRRNRSGWFFEASLGLATILPATLVIESETGLGSISRSVPVDRYASDYVSRIKSQNLSAINFLPTVSFSFGFSF